MANLTVRDICEYIACLDYIDYHLFFNICYGMYGQTVFKNIAKSAKYMRHKMYVISFDMILGGDYYG